MPMMPMITGVGRYLKLVNPGTTFRCSFIYVNPGNMLIDPRKRFYPGTRGSEDMPLLLTNGHWRKAVCKLYVGNMTFFT